MSRRRMMMQNANRSLLPKEYEAVEYVTAFRITTSVKAFSGAWDFDIDNPAASGSLMFVAYATNGSCYAGISGSKYWLGGNISSTGSCVGRQTPRVVFTSGKITLYVNGETVIRTSYSYPNNNTQLFGCDGSYLYTGRVYSVKCGDGKFFYGIPCKRVSDDTVGIYDAVSKTFYAKP